MRKPINTVTNIIAVVLMLALVAYAAVKNIGMGELLGGLAVVASIFGLARMGTKGMKSMAWLFVGAIIVGNIHGCGAVTTTGLDMSGQKINSTNQGDGVAGIAINEVDDEGNMTGKVTLLGKNLGVGTTIAMADNEGIWQVMPGLTGVMTFNPKTNQLQISSPKDTTIASFKYTPQPKAGETQIEITGLSMNISEPTKALVDAVNQYWPVLQTMTQTEAAKQIEQWKIAGQITDDIATLLGGLATKLLSP